MNQRYLTVLFVLLAVFGGIFYLAKSDTAPVSDFEDVELFADFGNKQITKVKLEQADGSVEIALNESSWGVPSRGGYPADVGKVRSFLLKLLSIEASQSIPGSERTYAKLGLNDEAVKRGRSKVTLYAKEEELGGVYLGELRKSKAGGPGTSAVTMGGGQYIRRVGKDDVFLISKPITLVTQLSHWLDTNVANVLRSKVESIEQVKVAEGAEKREFRLEMNSPESDEESSSLILAEKKKGDKVLDSSAVSQVQSGLENVRLSDVFRNDDETLKELSFDQRTVFQLANGLVYEVSSANKDSKFYAKMQVRYDEELARRLEEAHVAAQAQKEPEPVEEEKVAQAEEPMAEEKSDADEKTTAEAKKEDKKELKLSNAEEAEKINARLSPWIYVVPEYQGKKYRKLRSELFASS